MIIIILFMDSHLFTHVQTCSSLHLQLVPLFLLTITSFVGTPVTPTKDSIFCAWYSEFYLIPLISSEVILWLSWHFTQPRRLVINRVFRLIIIFGFIRRVNPVSLPLIGLNCGEQRHSCPLSSAFTDSPSPTAGAAVHLRDLCTVCSGGGDHLATFQPHFPKLIC